MKQNNSRKKAGSAQMAPPKTKGKNRPQKAVRPQAAPAAISRVLRVNPPVEKSGPYGSRTITYKEYVQDILGSVAFSATSFQCNPGLANLFAWLSGQALFYQEYVVRKLRFVIETEKATSLSGKVMLAFLQDSADPLPASKQEMLENQIKIAGAIWQSFALDVNMNNFPALGKARFIRGGTLAANLDVKTYDIGQLIVAVQGMADASAVSELYVEYTIELKTPIQNTATLANNLSAKLVGVTPSSVSFLGTTPTVTGGLNVTGTTNTLTFDSVGQFAVTTSLTGTGLFTSMVPVVSASTASVTNLGGISNAAANVGTTSISTVLVNVTARGQTVVLDFSTQATSISASTTRVSAYAIALA